MQIQTTPAKVIPPLLYLATPAPVLTLQAGPSSSSSGSVPLAKLLDEVNNRMLTYYCYMAMERLYISVTNH